MITMGASYPAERRRTLADPSSVLSDDVLIVEQPTEAASNKDAAETCRYLVKLAMHATLDGRTIDDDETPVLPGKLASYSFLAPTSDSATTCACCNSAIGTTFALPDDPSDQYSVQLRHHGYATCIAPLLRWPTSI